MIKLLNVEPDMAECLGIEFSFEGNAHFMVNKENYAILVICIKNIHFIAFANSNEASNLESNALILSKPDAISWYIKIDD